mgnify:CR=1 FL=1
MSKFIRSFAFKIWVPFSVTLLVIISITAWYYPKKQEQFFIENKTGQVLELAKTVAKSYELAFTDADETQVFKRVTEIINFAKNDAGIDKEIETELKIANLSALNSINNETINKGNVVYVKNNKRKLNTNTFINFRPYLAAREGFFKGALLIENNSEFKNFLLNKFSDLNFFEGIYVPINIYNLKSNENFIIFSGIGNHKTFLEVFS